MIKNFILIIFIMSSLSAFAGEARTLGNSPRGLLMGNAYTTLADDEYSLFYNPALLARHKGFSFYPFNPTVTGTNILKEPDRFSDLGGDATAFADAALGFPIHAGVNFAPGFKMGRFGITALMNTQTHLNLQNKVNPILDIDHRYDKGFVAGYGQALTGGYVSGGSGEHLALGASVKYIDRESIYGGYYLLGPTVLDAIDQEEIEDILAGLGKVSGQGWGFDFGIDYVKSSGSETFSAGLAFMDIVTNLETEENADDFEVQPQPMQVNFGTSYTQKIGTGLDLTFSADIKNLQEQQELMRRLHLGIEVGLSPALSIIAGVNALDNYSYGVKLNTGLIKAYAGFYGVEVGEKLGQEESNRFLVYLSLFHFTFDP